MIEAFLAGCFGLLIGSFLNVCIYRLPRDLSVVRPRSFCPACERGIAWYDNLPLLSYAALGGRCRYCAASIPLRYPVVELLTGVWFFTSVLLLGPHVAAAKLAAFGAILITLIFSDIEERILPDEFTLGGAALGIVFAYFAPIRGGLVHLFLFRLGNEHLLSVGEALFAALFASGALWIVGALYEKVRHREGLGFGDVKMVAMIGAFLGIQSVLFTLMLGSLLGAVIGLAFILRTGKDAATYELPFGTFLGVAAMFVALASEGLGRWYGGLG